MGLRNQRASGHEILEKLFNVLIVDIQLFFKAIQLGIVENLPPFAAQHRVLRLRYFPWTGILNLRG